MPDAAFEHFDFSSRFLDFIFAKLGNTSSERFPDDIDGLSLADSEEFNFRRIASGLSSSRGNIIVNFGKARGKIVHQANLSGNILFVILTKRIPLRSRLTLH